MIYGKIYFFSPDWDILVLGLSWIPIGQIYSIWYLGILNGNCIYFDRPYPGGGGQTLFFVQTFSSSFDVNRHLFDFNPLNKDFKA